MYWVLTPELALAFNVTVLEQGISVGPLIVTVYIEPLGTGGGMPLISFSNQLTLVEVILT
ncbi:hypothetical protein D3C80_862080 [compost metagenome]